MSMHHELVELRIGRQIVSAAARAAPLEFSGHHGEPVHHLLRSSYLQIKIHIEVNLALST